MESQTEEKSFFADLWERRIPQVFASYLIGSWAFVQFVDWVVNRYDLASGWTECAIIFLGILIPSVLMITAYHGRPGPDKWRRVEKIFVPINFVFAAFLAIFLFPAGVEAEATQTVTFTNMDGDTLKREVPTIDFLRRFVLFPLEVESDKDDDWMGYALPILVEKKLEQDVHFTAIQPTSLVDDAKDYNQTFDKVLPKNIYRTIASDNYSNYFINGRIARNVDGYALDYEIYQTQNGQLKKDGKIQGSDLFSIADEFHNELRSQVFLKDYLSSEENFIDLPAKQLISSTEVGLMHYTKGLMGRVLANDRQQVAKEFQSAIDSDAECAECYKELGKSLMGLVGIEAKQEPLEKALSLSTALPERQQFEIKHWYYFPQDYQKALQLSEMWRKLYPLDIKPYDHLIQMNQTTRNFSEAYKVGMEAIDQGHGGKLLLEMSGIATVMGKEEESRELIQKFREEYPKKAETADEVGYALLYEGDHEGAIEFFENKILMNPGEYMGYWNKAICQSVTGNYTEELGSYEKALLKANSIADSLRVYTMIEVFYSRMGRIEKLFEVQKERHDAMRPSQSPLSYEFDAMNSLYIGQYISVGKEEIAKKKMEAFVRKYENPNFDFGCVGRLNFYIAAEDGEQIKKLLEECSDFLMRTDGAQTLDLANAVADLANENYSESIANFQSYCEKTGLPEYMFAPLLGRALRLNGDLEKAITLYEKSLQMTSRNGQNLIGLAELYKQKGQMQKAKTHVEEALSMWGNADPDYIPKKEAEVLLKELQG